MGKPKAPSAPDPAKTASAQTSTNIGTAIANGYLQNVNQSGPDGTLTYSQTGTKKWTDPMSGKVYNIPITTATTALSAAQQGIYDTNQSTQQNIANIGKEQSGRIQGLLSSPVDLNNEAVEGRINELGSKRLDPRFARDEEALRTRLVNQGVREGSAAYDAAMNNFGQSKNDAYNQLALTGRSQAVQEALTARNQPINEITALLSGSQVSAPQFQNIQNPTAATVDYAGLVNQNYANQMGAYNAKMGQTNGILGGLFGLGSSAIMASDERVKTNIKPVGNLKGHKLYEWNYTGKFDDGKRHTGVIAQQVEKKRPDAVLMGSDGVRRVDYGKLFQIGAEMAGEAA
jgi:hypothetical protein